MKLGMWTFPLKCFNGIYLNNLFTEIIQINIIYNDIITLPDYFNVFDFIYQNYRENSIAEREVKTYTRLFMLDRHEVLKYKIHFFGYS